MSCASDNSFLSFSGAFTMSVRDLIPWPKSRDFLPDFFHDDRTSPFLTLHRDINRLFDEAFRGFSLPASMSERYGDFVSGSWPKLEVTESDKQITISAEIPGIDEKDIELTYDDGSLILRGETKSETEDKERKFSERFYGRFQRRIPIGTDVEEDKIDASFKNGVLKVTLPKSEKAQTKAKKIAIQSAK